MPFQKGNQLGKHTKRGKDNKSSRIRKMFAEIVEENIENAKERMQELDNPQFFKALGMMLRHVLPAQKQIEMEVEQQGQPYVIDIINRIDQITDEQAGQMLEDISSEASRKLKEEKNNVAQD
jgi:hypothetical protein